MPRQLLLAAAALAVAGLAGAGLVVATRQVRDGVGAPTPGPSAAVAARAAPAPAAPAPAARPRTRPRLALADAMRELDLIRPSRERPAQPVTVPLLGGGRFTLGEQRGKLVLVNFWATWCPPCREEMPAMERLWRAHRDDDFVLIAVSVDADPAAVGPFVAEFGLTFPVGLDPRMDVANAWGVRALPSSFLVDGRGVLAAMALGPRAWDNNAAHALVEGLRR